MKKVLLGVVALSCVALANDETNLYLKAGVDMSGKYDMIKLPDHVEMNRERTNTYGYEFAVEATRNYTEQLELGIGLAYQNHVDPEPSYSRKYYVKTHGYKSMPIYLTAKYNFETESNIKPYFKTDLGYSFNFGEKDGTRNKYENVESVKESVDDEVYYGIGLGVEYNNFVSELIYKINTAKVGIETNGLKSKEDFDYFRLTLSLGYKFDI